MEHINLLELEFSRRKATNPRYSLRAFAKTMGLPPGRVSEFLSGKRKPTAKVSAKITERLGLSPAQARALFGRTSGMPESRYTNLDDDVFSMIAAWYHTAFLSLIDTRDFRSDPAWIARRLGISVIEVRAMLQRMERLGLLEIKKGHVRKAATNLKTNTDIPNAALRRSHKESILQAVEAIEAVPTEERDITSMTMAIDPRRLPLAKTLIRKFRFRLADLLETGDRTEVYNLNVQLVPVTKKDKI
ncbi:MAG: TIGR02147 family protein [Bdellovibrionota bacterium]